MRRQSSIRRWSDMKREADEAIVRGEVSKPQNVKDCIASLRAVARRTTRRTRPQRRNSDR